jgi:uncharacterized membrane protein
MRRNNLDAVIVLALAAICGAILLLVGHGPAAVIAAVLLLFLLPGRAVAIALFPAEPPGSLNLNLWTVGLSLTVDVLGGLLLNVTVGLQRDAWSILLSVVALAVGALALVRRQRATPGTAGLAETTPDGSLPAVRPRWWRPGGWQIAVTSVAVFFGAVAIWISWHSATTQERPGFTQLWLAPKGAATTATTASLGVTNNEDNPTQYVVVYSNGGKARKWTLDLAVGQTWRATVAVQAKHQAVADLYLTSVGRTPYRHVTLKPGVGT